MSGAVWSGHEQIVPRDECELETECQWSRGGVCAKEIAQHIVEQESLEILLAEERQVCIAELEPEERHVHGQLEDDENIHNMGQGIPISNHLLVPCPRMLPKAGFLPF